MSLPDPEPTLNIPITPAEPARPKRVASEKQVEANRKNAAKSTGPRTAEGKMRSSANSIKHGLCAQVAAIPGEDPGLFDERFEAWRPALNPGGDPHGDYLVGLAVRHSIRIDRCQGVNDATVAKRARDAVRDRREQREREVEDLLHGLTLDSDAAVRRLMGTALGCRRLAREWARFEIPLAEPVVWDMQDAKRALVLLGEYMPNHRLAPDIFYIPTHAIEMQRDVLFRIVGNENPQSIGFDHRYSTYPSLREKDARSIDYLTVKATVARQDLLAIIARNKDYLLARALELDATEAIDDEEAVLRTRFDIEPSGALIHRYEQAEHRGLYKALDALAKHRKETGNPPQRSVTPRVGADSPSPEPARGATPPLRNEPISGGSTDPDRRPIEGETRFEGPNRAARRRDKRLRR